MGKAKSAVVIDWKLVLSAVLALCALGAWALNQHQQAPWHDEAGDQILDHSDSIGEMETDIAVIKTDIRYIKEGVTEQKEVNMSILNKLEEIKNGH